jgi:RNA polymerase sigma-70 factor, ECF subfamily
MSTIQPNIEQPVSEEMQLVRRAKRGDDSAFEELVRRYDRNVFRIAQHITQNREDAEDVVQEAFLKAYGNLAKFQEQSKFYTWLVRIAVNEALMKLRRRRPERTVSLDEDVKTEDDSLPREVADWSPNPEQMYNQAELRDILTRTIQGLPPGFRTVFVSTRRGRPLDGRNGLGAGIEHPGGKVAVVARAFAVARTAEPLLSEKGEWRWRTSEVF